MPARGLEASMHKLPAAALGGARRENARIALADVPGSSRLENTRGEDNKTGLDLSPRLQGGFQADSSLF